VCAVAAQSPEQFEYPKGLLVLLQGHRLVPAQMWAPASPGADVGQLVPAQMWAVVHLPNARSANSSSSATVAATLAGTANTGAIRRANVPYCAARGCRCGRLTYRRGGRWRRQLG